MQKSVDKAVKWEYTYIEHLNNSSSVAMRLREMQEQEDKTTTIRNQLPNEDIIYSLAELFKALGDPTRAKILSCLQVKDLCVGEIAEILEMSVSAVSHQLRVLRNIKLVKGVKDGKEVKYSLDDDHVTLIMQCGLSHVNE